MFFELLIYYSILPICAKFPHGIGQTEFADFYFHSAKLPLSTFTCAHHYIIKVNTEYVGISCNRPQTKNFARTHIGDVRRPINSITQHEETREMCCSVVHFDFISSNESTGLGLGHTWCLFVVASKISKSTQSFGNETNKRIKNFQK